MSYIEMLSELDAANGVALSLIPIILAAGWLHRQRDKRRHERQAMSTQTTSISQTTSQVAQYAADCRPTWSPIPLSYTVGICKFREIDQLAQIINRL